MCVLLQLTNGNLNLRHNALSRGTADVLTKNDRWSMIPVPLLLIIELTNYYYTLLLTLSSTIVPNRFWQKRPSSAFTSEKNKGVTSKTITY